MTQCVGTVDLERAVLEDCVLEDDADPAVGREDVGRRRGTRSKRGVRDVHVVIRMSRLGRKRGHLGIVPDGCRHACGRRSRPVIVTRDDSQQEDGDASDEEGHYDGDCRYDPGSEALRLLYLQGFHLERTLFHWILLSLSDGEERVGEYLDSSRLNYHFNINIIKSQYIPLIVASIT